MSRKGNCWDNAPTESWFNSFKNERVFGERFLTRDAMKATAVVFGKGRRLFRHHVSATFCNQSA